MAGNFVTESLGMTIGGIDSKGFTVDTSAIHFDRIQKLNKLAGSATTALVEYGLSGETTVNVLNAHTLAGLFGVDLKSKKGDAVTTGLFGLTFGKNGVHGSITMSGYAMDVTDIMAGMQSFRDISARNNLQRDINDAVRERERIKNITDRVIAIGEVSYEGRTDQALSLLDQLQSIRSLQSKDNLHSMFQNRAENGYSESLLDENLDLALNQHDISVSEFMNSAEFDTTGSFKHAMTFYNRSVGAMKAGGTAIKQLGYNVTLEDMFKSGKAYAGKEYAESDTYSDRVSIFTKYYADDIVKSESMASPEKMFEGVFMNNDQICAERGGFGLNGDQMVKNMLANNELRGVGDMLANVQKLRSLFDAALTNGPGSPAVDVYKKALNSLKETGAFNIDGRYNGFITQNKTEQINAQKAYVEANRELYEGGIRTPVDGGYHNYYERDGRYYRTGIAFDIPNGRSVPLTSSNNTVEISAEQYSQIVDISEGRYRDEALARLSEAGANGEYYSIQALYQAFISASNEMSLYQKATYCNLNNAGYAVAVGAINVQFDGTKQYSANTGNDRLHDGLFNDTGGYLQVTKDYAEKFASFGMYGFASAYGNPSGHHSPFVYKNGKLSFMNVGGTFNMNATLDEAFGSSRGIDYWMWLEW
jgi:hypothetical protein